jgi:hypothetical protein
MDISPSGEPCAFWVWSLDTPNHPVSHYKTDPAACIRAAEAWRKKVEGRSYETRSQIDDEFGTRPASAVCFSRTNQIAGGGQGDYALAKALIRATGGPA